MNSQRKLNIYGTTEGKNCEGKRGPAFVASIVVVIVVCLSVRSGYSSVGTDISFVLRGTACKRKSPAFYIYDSGAENSRARKKKLQGRRKAFSQDLRIAGREQERRDDGSFSDGSLTSSFISNRKKIVYLLLMISHRSRRENTRSGSFVLHLDLIEFLGERAE